MTKREDIRMQQAKPETHETQWLPISKVATNKGQIEGLPANPRFIRNDRYEKLKKSIQEDPEMTTLREVLVVPRGKAFVIIGGNMRYQAFKELGWKEIPCKVLPEDTDAKKLRAIATKDNVNFGDWDHDLLANEWNEIELLEWGVPAWDTEDVCQQDKKEASDDDFDIDKKIEERVKYGDIWMLGEHMLICGDSTNAETYKRLFQDGKVADLVVTDPPYNVAYEGGTKDKLTIKNDDMSDEAFSQFLIKAFKGMAEVLKAGGSFYIWHSDSYGEIFRRAVREGGLTLKQNLIWNKNSMVLGRQDYQWKHEPCLYGWKEGASHYFVNERNHTTVLDFPKPQRSDLHPTMKPIPLIAYQIENSSKKNQIVLDPFGGSGTTLIACEQIGRTCRTIELDTHYCSVILNRWEEYTGNKATKINE